MKIPATLVLLLPAFFAGDCMALDYEKDIVPLLKEHCYECHSNEKGKTKGNLVLDDIEEMKKYQITPHSLIQPENPEESQFLVLMKLPPNDSDAMPPDGARMPMENLKIIEQWIAEGATIDGLTRDAAGEDKAMSSTGSGGNDAAEKAAGTDGSKTGAVFLFWTNTEGRKIEAKFGGLGDGKVTLLMRDGKSYPYPLANLDEESQAQARALAGGATGSDQEKGSN